MSVVLQHIARFGIDDCGIPGCWICRGLAVKVELDMLGFEVSRDLTWVWPRKPTLIERVTQLTDDLNDQYRYIPGRYLPRAA